MAVTTAVVGAGSGLVLGVAAGRLVWNGVVDALSIEARPTQPVAFVVSLALAAPIVSMLIAAPHARRASAVRPAVVLREE